MWQVILQFGLLSGILLFMNNLTILGSGLVGLIWLATGLIVAMAANDYRAQIRRLWPAVKPTNK